MNSLTHDEIASVAQARGSEDVAWLQKWLRDVAEQNLKVDGIGGSVTRAAFIQAFANRNAPAITPAEMEEIARSLGDTDTRRIRAVAKVESNGGGWFDSGLPKILYERHRYWKLTAAVHRIVSWFANPQRGGYTTDANNNGINDSWEKLSYAVCKDPLAALQSVSIGKFQIMGEHYRLCGFAHPVEMLWAARNSELAHYHMLRDYILKVANLRDAFLSLSTNAETCRRFAAGYNGKAYEENAYHKKLAAAMK